MFDLNYLFKGVNENKKVIKKGNKIRVDVENYESNGQIEGRSINDFLEKSKYLFTINPKMKRIDLYIHGRFFGDDAVILYVELVIKSLFDYGYKDIYLYLPEYDNNSMTAALFDMSIISKCLNRSRLLKRKEFLNYYDKMFVDKNTDYRKSVGVINKELLRLIIKNDGYTKSPSCVGTLVYDYLYLQYENGKLLFSDEYIDAAVNIVVEIVDNTLCHTKSDCIFSMKVCDLTDSRNRKFMLSINFSNFDDTIIGSYIDEGLKNGTLKNATKEKVEAAYEYHKHFFNEEYDYDKFTMVSVFQRGVTTRDNATNDSGRGLTTFLKSLLVATKFYSCYVYSGNNLMNFESDLIVPDKNGYIGFNKSGKYIDDIPDLEIFSNMKYHNNGTLYNIMLIYDRGDKI